MARDKRIGIRLSNEEWGVLVDRSRRERVSMTDYLLKVVRDDLSRGAGKEGVYAQAYKCEGEGADSAVEVRGELES